MKRDKTQRYMFMSGVVIVAILFFSTAWGRLLESGVSEYEIKRRWRAFQRKQHVLTPGGVFPYMKEFDAAAARHGLALPLLLAIGMGESGFNSRSVSTEQCFGLMQIQFPETAGDLELSWKDRFHPAKNIMAGAKYFAMLLERYEGDIYRSLAAYNYGPGRIRKQGGIPRGAQLYADYIYNNLQSVLQGDYQAVNRLLVLKCSGTEAYTGMEVAQIHIPHWVKTIAEDPGNTNQTVVPFQIRKSSSFTYDIYITYRSPKERKTFTDLFRRSTGIVPLGLRAE